MTSVVDIASVVTSGATSVALVFAGLELRRSRAHDQRRRRVEIEGVAVSWVPGEVPRAAQDATGAASWVYEFTADNPGQLPISDVRIEVWFGLDVQRIRHDGHRDDPTRRLILETPVLAGGGRRTWRRRLLMDYVEGEARLRETTAVISFLDPDDARRRQQNHWPKGSAPSPGSGLSELRSGPDGVSSGPATAKPGPEPAS